MADRNYGTVLEAAKFEKFVDKLIADGKPIGFDIESSYSHPTYIEKGATLQFHPSWFMVSFSFTNSTNWARSVPLAHANGGNVDDVQRTARALWRMVNSGLIVAHNLPFEVKGCRRFFIDTLWDDPEVGEEVRAADGFFEGFADSMIEVWMAAAYEPKASGLTNKDLKGVTKLAFGHEMVHFDELFKDENGKAKKDKRFDQLDPTDPQVTNYACEDAVWCLALHELHYPELEGTFLWKVEMGLVNICIEMELVAMALDWDEISRKADEVAHFKDLMNEEIQKDLSERLKEQITVNLGSPKQLAEILFDKLGLPVKERSEKTGAPSTSEPNLRAIAAQDIAVRQILEWKELAKLYGSYLDKYRKQLNYAGNGLAYPNHNQAGTLTGRFSVDGVSYQQWPKPYHYELKSGETYDLNFRDLLISPPGYRIVGYDFSQVELRVLAGMANETALLKAFADGVDIHKATASTMKGIPLDQITKKDRSEGKQLNFAVVYGSGAAAIGDTLGVSKEEAQKLLDTYFATFSGLKTWMDTKVAEGRQQGYVETMFGRKFTVWDYTDPRDWVRAKGDRMCVNAPVQGGAADYMKIGMNRVSKVIKKAEREGVIPKDGIRMFMTVHDALEFYVHESVPTQLVIDLINPAVSFPVPGLPEIRADWHEGERWGSVVELVLDENKQITAYALEDVEQEFETLEEAKAYFIKARDEKLASYKNKPKVEEPAPQADVVVVQEKVPEAEAPKKRTRKPLLDDGDDLLSLVAAPEEKAEPAAPAAQETPEVVVDDEEPVWRHGAEWHAQNDTEPPMALTEPEPKSGQRILITLRDMPTETQFESLEAYLKERPGADTVVLQTPEGPVEFDTRHTITSDQQPVLSLMLGGADLVVAPESIDIDELLAGIEL